MIKASLNAEQFVKNLKSFKKFVKHFAKNLKVCLIVTI